jgi:hypothetical protein
MAFPAPPAIGRALAAGAAGAIALSLARPLARAIAGGEPTFAADRIAARLAARTGLRLDRRGARRLGTLLRWTYAPGLALARELVVGRPRARRAGRALAFGAAIYGLELVALPATGATPPPARWRARELGALAAHVLTFALTVELTA